jgi:hypothetical protein
MLDTTTRIETIGVVVTIAAILIAVAIFISMFPDLRVWLLTFV